VETKRESGFAFVDRIVFAHQNTRAYRRGAFAPNRPLGDREDDVEIL
jgi:hypothetical protein